jgi:hypothetical protein
MSYYYETVQITKKQQNAEQPPRKLPVAVVFVPKWPEKAWDKAFFKE